MSRAPVERFEGDVLLATGAVFAGLGVAAGAFGAHALRGRLDADELEIWRTAASYQMYHALALIVVARLLSPYPTRLFRTACGLFILGIVLFSGSLYALALTGERRLGIGTPFGGIAFLGGWGCLAVGILRSHRA